MSETTKQLMIENTKREKGIAPENKEVYTNMIAYIRGSNLTDKNIEEIREDITEMLLDAQYRGDNIEQVFGENYKKICDEIIDALPKKTAKDHFLEIVDIILRCTWILGAIAFVMSIITDLASQQGLGRFNITNGQAISMVLIILLSYGFVTYISKTSLNQDDSKKKTIIETSGAVLSIILVTLPIVFFNIVILEVSYLIAALIIGLLFGASKIIGNKR